MLRVEKAREFWFRQSHGLREAVCYNTGVALIRSRDMLIEYVHPQLGQDIQGRAGYSVPMEEGIIDYAGREVLYVSGYASVERSCCSGGSNWGYVQVPGYLVARENSSRGRDLPVSRIEIIEDPEDRAGIKRILTSRFPGAQIEIWDIQYRQ